jgi:DNA-binding SARP family transcriptional activator
MNGLMMVEISILGSAKLVINGKSLDQSFVSGPKRLALLTYLLLARPGEFYRRDTLISLFWPEKGQKSARNALSNMLYHIRNSLGKDTLTIRGSEEICLNPDKIWCDVLAFKNAAKQERFQEALELYRNDLLPGFHVSDVSNDFQNWLDRERESLRKQVAEISWILAENAEESDDQYRARMLAQRAVSHSGLSEDANRRYIELLNRLGERSEALRVYREFSSRLKEDLELEPSSELKVLAEKIRRTNPVQKNREKSATERTIAVLPFETIGNGTSSSFTVGVHNEILTRLSNISDIRVICRTSVRKYIQSNKTVKEIADELQATWILEGEVQENDGRIHLNVHLINAESNLQVWAQNYLRSLTASNLFQIQSEITKEIASSLKAKLTHKEKKRIELKSTESLTAYRLYMQGWSWLEQRTEKGMHRGLDYFDQALERDPEFALALTGRALGLLALYGYGYKEARNILPEAERLILNALNQDQNLAEAYSALGLLYSSRYQGPESIRELQKAVSLRPGYANAHNKLSWVYQLTGNRAEALKSARTAVNLDPFSPEAVINLAFSYLINGDFENAQTKIDEVRKLQPDWTTGIFYEGIILYHLEKYDQAGNLLKELSVEWAGEGPRATYALANIAMGNLSEAAHQIELCLKGGDYFAAGLIQAALGDIEKAYMSLEQIETWSEWPTHALYFLYPEIVSRLKRDHRFQQVYDSLQTQWGLKPVNK